MFANLRQSAIPPWGDTVPVGVTRLLCTPMLPSIRIMLRFRLSIIQLKNCLIVLALVGSGATLDCRHGSFSRSLNLSDVVEKFGRGFWGRFCPVGHYALIGVTYLAITALITERRRRIARIGNPHAVKRDVKRRFSRGCRCHALANRAHVAVDALNSLIGVLAARQVRAPRVHFLVRLLGRSDLAVARLAKLFRGLPQLRLLLRVL